MIVLIQFLLILIIVIPAILVVSACLRSSQISQNQAHFVKIHKTR
jgi:hypothetical protein